MSWGGARANSGRKALDPFDTLTMFCVGELGRMLLLDPDLTKSRMMRQVKRVNPDDLAHQRDLEDAYEKLCAETSPTPAERQGLIKALKKKGIEDEAEMEVALKAGLRQIKIAKRAELLAKTGLPDDADNGTVLDDIRYMIDDAMGGRRVVPLPELSPTELGRVFAEIARLASQEFDMKITARQVKRRVALHHKAIKIGHNLKNGEG
jgi:hypothetical protein